MALKSLSRKSKEKKARVAASTSASLGLRIGGMQSYRPLEGTYLFRDKYYGRAATQDQFFQTLQIFFSDGRKVLKDIIQDMLVKVRHFSSILQTEARFRFYSSSLLLVFEGKPEEEKCERKDRRCDVRMIDFAKTCKLSDAEDDGISKGFDSLIICLEKLLLSTDNLDPETSVRQVGREQTFVNVSNSSSTSSLSSSSSSLSECLPFPSTTASDTMASSLITTIPFSDSLRSNAIPLCAHQHLLTDYILSNDISISI